MSQKKENILHYIYYATKAIILAQANNTISEKEMFALVYAFDKFRSYLVDIKVIVYNDHATITYMSN